VNLVKRGLPQEESAGGLSAGPSSKSILGGRKKSRRNSAPGLKKYDPDESVFSKNIYTLTSNASFPGPSSLC